ncbi:DNA-(apurinic or apyrimidinic site) lyase 2 [Nosema granulosis]|uniref:DNA-(Apurinic or apyrimidinic site) lyase 2 n=1 Tax=Nosema granulosis TaxID=83296 RepID=A0A9P6H231_9MICR|nr:DNA-(apurinic or apyrimidinic site) lyase 2 [Nosema granulosis]
MKIVSFNINGIKSFCEYIKEKYKMSLNSYLKDILGADIACFQEVKSTSKHMLTYSTMLDYIAFTNLNRNKNGVYGVSTFVRKNLYCRKNTIKVPFSDHGRALLTDHGTFKVLNLYFPFYDEAGTKDRTEVIRFYDEIKKFIDRHEDLILCGDFNAVYNVYDHFMYLKEYYKLCNEDIPEYFNSKVGSRYIDRVSTILQYNLNPEELINKKNILQKLENYSSDSNSEHFVDLLKNFRTLYKPGQSRYLDFIYSAIKDIQIDRESEIQFTEYKKNLIEKHFSPKTELPYLLNSKQEAVGLLLSSYQRLWLLNLILELKYIDVFRIYCSEYHQYTCWNTLLNLRPTNQGTRIDYIFVPSSLLKHVQNSGISPDFYGSDHCPVFINLNIEAEGREKNILETKNNILAFLKRN